MSSLVLSLAETPSSPPEISIELSAQEVREILKETSFDEKDILSWNQTLQVPFGVSSKFFVVCTAMEHGLSFDYEALYPGISGYISIAGGVLPKFALNNAQKINISKFCNSPKKTFPAKIFVHKATYPGRKDPCKVLVPIQDHLLNRRFLYRGIRTWRIDGSIYNGFTFSSPPSPENYEFGPGLYTTPNLSYAIQYAGRNGMLLIFDWTDNGGDIATKTLVDQEWQDLVKANICINYDTRPSILPPVPEEDILVGRVSNNYNEIITCHKPEPSQVEQVVARTTPGLEAFEARLFAVIYLY